MADLVPMSQAATTSLVTTLQNTDLFALAREDITSETGYRSKVARVDAMAKKVVNETDYSQLQTTNKKIIGAINEVNTKASQFDNMTATASGSIATFDNGGDDIPVSEFECDIVAQQASGTPTPDNPLPITGFSQSNILVASKNLFNKATIVSNKWFSDNGSEISISGRFYSALIPVEPNTDYYLTNVVGAGSFISTVHFESDRTTIIGAKNILGANTQSGYITTFANSAFMLINGFLSDIDTVQVVKGNTATAYENPNIYTVAFGQTIYGGRLIYENGQWSIEATHGVVVDLGALSWTKGSKSFYADITGAKLYDQNVIPNMLCEIYRPVSYNDLVSEQYNEVCSINNNNSIILMRDTNYATASDFTTAVTGKKAIYKLATPVIIPITSSTRVKTISGDNNIYSNTGDCELKYFTNKADSLAELIKAFVV